MSQVKSHFDELEEVLKNEKIEKFTLSCRSNSRGFVEWTATLRSNDGQVAFIEEDSAEECIAVAYARVSQGRLRWKADKFAE